MLCNLAAALRHSSAESLASCTPCFPGADAKPVTQFSLLRMLATVRTDLLRPVREPDPIPAAVFASFQKWARDRRLWGKQISDKGNSRPIRKRRNKPSWLGQPGPSGLLPCSLGLGREAQRRVASSANNQLCGGRRFQCLPFPMGKGKVLYEGQPGVAEDRAFPNIAGVKWSKMGFRLHLGDTGLTDEHGERTGSGWDGVKFPGSNHYRAVVFTCSYNGVDSTPMFSSR